MLPVLLVATVMALGQTEASAPETPAAPSPAALEIAATVVAEPPKPPNAAAAPAPALPDRWLLMKSLQGTPAGGFLDDHRMQIYGWADSSFTASSDQASNLPMGFNYRANEFLLQQNWVRFDRSMVTSGTTEPTCGFRVDWILPGSDYRFTAARGLFSGQLTADEGEPNLYGVDPIQFYGEVYFPTIARGLDVKVGKFFAQYGVEANDAPSNALASHAYTFIYNPFTHTGLLTTTKLTDAWTVATGLVLGSDVFISPADEPTFIGNAKWVESDQRASIQLAVIVGPGRFNQAEDFNNPEVFDLVVTRKLNARLAYTFESLFGFETNVPNIGTADWLGVVHYLTYDFTPRLSGTTRLEFFDDFQGQRTGFPGLYTALTAGLSFRPRKAIILRPELRYDYNEETRPFEDKHGLFTASADVILRW